jgi:hypothetical protein
MTSPKLVAVTFNGDPLQSAIDHFMGQLVAATAYWSGATAEYGVGPLAPLSTQHLAEAPPSAPIADVDVQRWLKTKIMTGAASGFPQPDGNTAYVLYYPSGTMLTMTGGTLCGMGGANDFQGYHGDFAIVPGGAYVVYAVVGRCPSPVPGLAEIEEVSAEASHEIVEAATDPLPLDNPAYIQVDSDHQGWALIAGGEIGDMCAWVNPDAFYYTAGVDNLVQRVWSNKAAAMGHDPCEPNGMNPYFNAAPVLGDTIQIPMPSGAIPTKGVQIPVGSSRIIEIDLYSDATTGGPWKLSALDLSSALFGSVAPALTFAFDKSTGQNGDKVHLTITSVAPGPLGVSPFWIQSDLGMNSAFWVGVVGN